MTKGDEDPTLHELIPGLLMALSEGRSRDAYDLAGHVVDEVDSPQMAVLHVALAANLLHKTPGVPLSMLAILLRGETFNDDRTDAEIGMRFLDVIAESMEGTGSLSEDSEQFLRQFEMRPGSTALMKLVLATVQVILSDFEMRVGVKMASPLEAAELRRHAIDSARAAITPGEPPTKA